MNACGVKDGLSWGYIDVELAESSYVKVIKNDKVLLQIPVTVTFLNLKKFKLNAMPLLIHEFSQYYSPNCVLCYESQYLCVYNVNNSVK